MLRGQAMHARLMVCVCERGICVMLCNICRCSLEFFFSRYKGKDVAAISRRRYRIQSLRAIHSLPRLLLSMRNKTVCGFFPFENVDSLSLSTPQRCVTVTTVTGRTQQKKECIERVGAKEQAHEKKKRREQRKDFNAFLVGK